MKTLTTTLRWFTIAATMFFVSGSTFAEPYLFELLTKPAYAKSWKKLLTGEKNIPPWLAQYAKTKDGPSTPGKAIQLDKGNYQIGTVCKTHDCGANQFFVLFAPDGTQAWGILLINRETERFFGNPDDEKKAALRAAANE